MGGEFWMGFSGVLLSTGVRYTFTLFDGCMERGVSGTTASGLLVVKAYELAGWLAGWLACVRA